MGSAPPPSYFIPNDGAPNPFQLPQSQPPQPHPGPFLDQLPPVPRWHLEPIQPQNPCDLRDEQLQVIAASLAQEVEEHSSIRSRFYRNVTASMKHERDLNAERYTVRYLHSIVHNLRTQVQHEKMRRLAVEEEKQQLLLGNDLECEMQRHYDGPAPPPLGDNQTLTDIFDHPTVEDFAASASHAPARSGPVASDTLVDVSDGHARRPDSPEAFALDDKSNALMSPLEIKDTRGKKRGASSPALDNRAVGQGKRCKR